MQNAPRNPVLAQIQKNLMVALDERKAQLRAEGRRLFDFGLGDPREPTPSFIRDALRSAVPESSQYPSAMGTPALRRACAGYLDRRFGVRVDPERQIVPATGAKETIFHLPFAFSGAAPSGAGAAPHGSGAAPSGEVRASSGGGAPRRKVVMPDPGYPTYEVGARFAGLEPVKVPLTAERRFLLEPDVVGEATLAETLLFWINYPHNPTGAAAPRDYLERVARAARRHGFIVVSDECYCDTYFGAPPLSMLEVQVENVLAVFSCSKRSGMTGYRSGFVAGDPDLVAILKQLRSHPGVASPEFVSAAATAAWNDDAHALERREILREKRELFLSFFASRGIRCEGSDATLYLWVRVPEGQTSATYALALLERGIVVAPGTAFGAGEGYVRVALVPDRAECEDALREWEKVRA